MQIKINWHENGYETDVAEDEGALWKEVAKNLPNIPIPNSLEVGTPYGDARLTLRQRGTYVKDGVKCPSLYVVPDYNYISGLPSGSYEEAYLTCINPESNNYKFYHLKPSGRGIDATYGRIGSARGEAFGIKDLQQPYDHYLYWVRYYEKLSKGYTDQTSIYLAPAVEAKKVVKKKAAKNSVSAALYAKLQGYARHVVQKNLQNERVTLAQVKESKRLLNEMGKRKSVKGFNAQLQKLLAVCPRKARYVSLLLADEKEDFPEIMAREENLIAAMEAIVSGDTITEEQDDSFDSMKVEVYIATEKQKEEVMAHLSDNLKTKVAQIYRVIPVDQKARFDAYLKKHNIKTVKQLWHGSRNENWFSILVNGLQLNPNAQITGKMFGQGVYFAPSSEKSWNYTDYYGTYWAGGRSDTAFMGLYATAYGTPLDVYNSGNYSARVLATQGKNCVHAHAGSVLRNDEIIFYDEDAMVLNYVVEFR